ncbi:MAG: aminoglycoside phosphotransferase family protein [Candidatus Aminicenantes bacterium]|nr:aminoglycoside phosphotransferase family protein [Candidatus Aminicenantes bacterium]
MKTKIHDLREIGSHFQICGDFVSGIAYGPGHINDTFAVTYNQAGTLVRYIHQRINHLIFKNVPALMENIHRVTNHLRSKFAALNCQHLSRRALTLVLTKDGKSYHVDGEGNYWRTYLFIEKAHTYDIIQNEQQAFQAARVLGQFQRYLADLPAPRLHETIPNFHNTPARFAALEEAINRDKFNRAESAREEIELSFRFKSIVGRLIDLQRQGKLPERVTHNDTKLNNFMLDEETGEGMCLVDLDTVMPGLSLYDFGDLVRTAANSGAEDERDLSKVSFLMPVFEVLVRGYLSEVKELLVHGELDHLPFSGQLITCEIGIRFLTDFLDGDVYYKVHREGHNLDRCRTQYKLVVEMERLKPEMQKAVKRYTS